MTVASFADAELTADQVIEEVSDQLNGLAENPGSSRVVLNFREVRFMSSSMLAVLLKFARKVTAAQGKVKLCCIAPNLMGSSRSCRFDRIFEIYDQESAALDSF